MYPEEMCAPMREDLTSVGFIALRTPEEVSELLDKKQGTVLVMVNSVCGCAAGNARPARWLSIGGFSIQTSDIARLSLIIFLSYYLDQLKLSYMTLLSIYPSINKP